MFTQHLYVLEGEGHGHVVDQDEGVRELSLHTTELQLGPLVHVERILVFAVRGVQNRHLVPVFEKKVSSLRSGVKVKENKRQGVIDEYVGRILFGVRVGLEMGRVEMAEEERVEERTFANRRRPQQRYRLPCRHQPHFHTLRCQHNTLRLYELTNLPTSKLRE